MTSPKISLPFDPEVAARLQARIDSRDLWHTEADVREALRQLAYAKDEALLLAEKCAAWRSQYEDTRGQLEAVRGWTRSRLELLSTIAPKSSTDAAMIILLDDLTRVLDHLEQPKDSAE